MKPYKTALPQDTICRIRAILHDVGLFTTEQHFRNENMHYSCRVYIDNCNLKTLDIGTNGKGMSSIYSLASAYGELMERIQNKMIIYVTKYATETFRRSNPELNQPFLPTLKFRYFVDEVFRQITSEELWKECCRFLPNAIKKSNKSLLKAAKYNMYYADFYNTNDNKVELLPYHLLRIAASSTGVCAGNTPEEAINQGLNEIFERYVLQQIYLKKLTPPTISFSLFEGTEILQRLKKLQREKKWYIEIKDCSLGKGFPVIGLLIIDRVANRYAFRLGADLSPEIALQRCFTEAFQGTEASEKHLRPIHLNDDWNVKIEHNKSIINGQGEFPKEIFLKEASWKFEDFILKSTDSHLGDLRLLQSWLSDNGYTLYIRDNSFLGFPAYHLFVPKLSEIDEDLFDIIGELEKSNETFYSVKSEYHLNSLTMHEISEFISKYSNSSAKKITLFPYNTSLYNQFNRLLLLALLSYKIGEDLDAYGFMDAFLKQMKVDGHMQNSYYYCVRDYFYAKSINLDNEGIVSLLESIYSINLVKEVVSDMENRENVLSNISFPNCFNCNECKIKSSCRYLEILHIEKSIQLFQAKNVLNQADLSSLFY